MTNSDDQLLYAAAGAAGGGLLGYFAKGKWGAAIGAALGGLLGYFAPSIVSGLEGAVKSVQKDIGGVASDISSIPSDVTGDFDRVASDVGNAAKSTVTGTVNFVTGGQNPTVVSTEATALLPIAEASSGTVSTIVSKATQVSDSDLADALGVGSGIGPSTVDVAVSDLGIPILYQPPANVVEQDSVKLRNDIDAGLSDLANYLHI